MEISIIDPGSQALFTGFFIVGVIVSTVLLVTKPNKRTHKIEYSEPFINFANAHDFKTSFEIGDEVHSLACNYQVPLKVLDSHLMINNISNFCIGEYQKHPLYAFSFKGNMNVLNFQQRFRFSYLQYTVVDLKLRNPRFEFADGISMKIKYDRKLNQFTTLLPNKREYTFLVSDQAIVEFITKHNVWIRVHKNSLFVFTQQFSLTKLLHKDDIVGSKIEDLYTIAIGLLPYLERTTV